MRLPIDTQTVRSDSTEVCASTEAKCQCSVESGTDVPRLLYTVENVGQALAIGRSKVYELMNAGLLPAVHIGRSVRFRASDIHDFVQGWQRCVDDAGAQ
jgi:excisionase family DNA binding protein